MCKELKKCPFCGSDAEIYKSTKGFQVACKATDANYHGIDGVLDDWCPMDLQTPHCQKEETVIAYWNERVTPTEGKSKKIKEER